MDATSSLFGILYTFSASLLYPVIIILILLVVFSLMLIGEFLSEYSKRHRDIENLELCCNAVREHVGSQEYNKAAKSLRNIKQNFMVMSFAESAAGHLEKNMLPAIEWLSQEYEIRMAKRLEQTRIVATISPMLGLMGTLIPLGPALIGLSQGDIVQLANNLMIAFATTVIGLFAGTIGYVLTQVRKRWYWQDMADIDYILDTLEVEE
ncbi:MotA/TolQ/ExbB proton channel family protein [Methanolobus sediminis]|uniref:MotA/TolQ/ExbB proton channel family protein n=1 Tax=Methanolobus sediminis TaxID=3072978 RepID=A0AA51UK39_9EURY|nr:MotA/TolQ/ExbB proton channel family protein [Methanolobus sediminis]WMW25012.1 MotA/TolQ/ExbB proton channel family protein [Methanolobus sediminis]